MPHQGWIGLRSSWLSALAFITCTTLAACGGSDGIATPRTEAEVGEVASGDASAFLEGTTVLQLESWPGTGAMETDSGTDRWEYDVEVARVLYLAPGAPTERPGSAVLVAFRTAFDGAAATEPSWNTPVKGPVYVVAGRAIATVGGVRTGDLVVKGVFVERLTLVGSPEATEQLRGFMTSRSRPSADVGTTEQFLVEWVRSLNEQVDGATGDPPMQQQWLEFQRGGRDPERNLRPETADPDMADRLRRVHVGIDSSDLVGGGGTVALFSPRGQLLTVPDGSNAVRRLTWVLPGERLEVRLLTGAGATSVVLGRVNADSLVARSASVVVRVSGSPRDARILVDTGELPADGEDAVPTSLPG